SVWSTLLELVPAAHMRCRAPKRRARAKQAVVRRVPASTVHAAQCVTIDRDYRVQSLARWGDPWLGFSTTIHAHIWNHCQSLLGARRSTSTLQLQSTRIGGMRLRLPHIGLGAPAALCSSAGVGQISHP